MLHLKVSEMKVRLVGDANTDRLLSRQSTHKPAERTGNFTIILYLQIWGFSFH